MREVRGIMKDQCSSIMKVVLVVLSDTMNVLAVFSSTIGVLPLGLSDIMEDSCITTIVGSLRS